MHSSQLVTSADYFRWNLILLLAMFTSPPVCNRASAHVRLCNVRASSFAMCMRACALAYVRACTWVRRTSCTLGGRVTSCNLGGRVTSCNLGGQVRAPLSPATPGAPIEVRICPRRSGLASLDCTLAGALPRTGPILVTCGQGERNAPCRKKSMVFPARQASGSSDEAECEIVCARACQCIGDGVSVKVCL
jgi:hypothetical protein